MASPKDKYFPETIPEENSSTEDEQVVNLFMKYNFYLIIYCYIYFQVIFHIPPCDEYNLNTEDIENNYSVRLFII